MTLLARVNIVRGFFGERSIFLSDHRGALIRLCQPSAMTNARLTGKSRLKKLPVVTVRLAY